MTILTKSLVYIYTQKSLFSEIYTVQMFKRSEYFVDIQTEHQKEKSTQMEIYTFETKRRYIFFYHSLFCKSKLVYSFSKYLCKYDV